jgi:hypothetical protein
LAGAEPFRRCVRSAGEERLMDKPKDEDLPHKESEAIEREAEKSRRELEEVPEHGTDPLHEGP